MRQLYFLVGLILGFVLAYVLLTQRPPAPLPENVTEADFRQFKTA